MLRGVPVATNMLKSVLLAKHNIVILTNDSAIPLGGYVLNIATYRASYLLFWSRLWKGKLLVFL
jgi:hypothetical protein